MIKHLKRSSLKSEFLSKFTEEIITNIALEKYPKSMIDKHLELRSSLTKEILPELNTIEKIQNPSLSPYLGKQPINQIIEQQSLPENSNPYEINPKLLMILNDKLVSNIECHGPGKFITIRRAGKIIPSKITLTNQEISDLVDYFSINARIPRLQGMFKAIINNWLITAIETPNGTRFIITIIPEENLSRLEF